MEMDLQQSITLPPPTARIQVTPCSFARRAPSCIFSRVGLDMMPLNSTISTPASFRIPVTSSYTPFFLMEPPPYPSNTLPP